MNACFDNSVMKYCYEYITHNGQTSTLTYLSSPDGLYGLHRILPDGSENIHYLHTDHLGSWTTITNEAGATVDEQSYDAWGNRRNPETWRPIPAHLNPHCLTEASPATFSSRLVCWLKQTNYGCQSR